MIPLRGEDLGQTLMVRLGASCTLPGLVLLATRFAQMQRVCEVQVCLYQSNNMDDSMCIDENCIGLVGCMEQFLLSVCSELNV